MYSYIKGELAELSENLIVVEAGGIGYQIFVPAGVLEEAPSIGEMIKVYTYLNVKEDAMDLYGFLTRDDRQIFKLLLGVNGIGPKGALGILSVLSIDELRFAVIGGDAKAISKAPGIGAKTAQRIILELKDKLNLEEILENRFEHTADKKAVVSATAEVRNEVVEALIALGYSPQESASAVTRLIITETSTTEELLRKALQQMAFL